jgi:hypothetical protein
VWSHIAWTLCALHVLYWAVYRWPGDGQVAETCREDKLRQHIVVFDRKRKLFCSLSVTKCNQYPVGTDHVLTDIRTRHYLNTILVSKLHQVAETPCSLVDRYCSFRINGASVCSPATRLHGATTQKTNTWPEIGLGLSATCPAAPQWLRQDTQRPRGVVMSINRTTERTPRTVQPHPNPALPISPHTRYIPTHSLPQNISQSVHHVSSRSTKTDFLPLYSPVVTLCTVRFKIQQFYVLPTRCICVLCGSQNKQQIFPYTALTDWFLQPRRSVYCAVRTGSLYSASLTFSNSTFCPHSVFVCFVWIWEQTAISLYSIN